jgi:hypothetical protein
MKADPVRVWLLNEGQWFDSQRLRVGSGGCGAAVRFTEKRIKFVEV